MLWSFGALAFAGASAALLVVRAVLSTVALGCLAWALAQYGRTVLGQ